MGSTTTFMIAMHPASRLCSVYQDETAISHGISDGRNGTLTRLCATLNAVGLNSIGFFVDYIVSEPSGDSLSVF